MAANLEKRLRGALTGSVEIESKNTRRRGGSGGVSKRKFYFTGRPPTSIYTNLNLGEVVNSENNGKQPSRAWADLVWASNVAKAINRVAGIEVYSKEAIKPYFDAVKSVVATEIEARKNNVAHKDSPEVQAARVTAEEKWLERFNQDKHKDAKLEEVNKTEQKLLQSFKQEAIDKGLVDIGTLYRLEPYLQRALTHVKHHTNAVQFVSDNVDRYKEELYQAMLLDKYDRDLTDPIALAKNIFDHHASEIGSFVDGLSYKGSKTTITSPATVSDILSGRFAQDGAGGALINHNSGAPVIAYKGNGNKERGQYSFILGVQTPNEGGKERVFVTITASLPGRTTSSYSIGVPFNDWLDNLPVKGGEADVAKALEQQKAQAEQRQARLEAELAVQQEAREQALRELAELRKVKQSELKERIENLKQCPELTNNNVAGTYIETKGLGALLDTGAMKAYRTTYKNVPCIGIIMGDHTEPERGIQYIADPGKQWQIYDDFISKNFDVVEGDMERNFFQLGEIGEETIIITAEGFATAGEIYLAAKNDGMDVCVVAGMFAANMPNVVKECSTVYPDNVIINAADNDCWNKNLSEGEPLAPKEIVHNTGAYYSLVLHDQYGVASFGPNFEAMGLAQEAQDIKATDWNDLGELIGKSAAQQVIVSEIKRTLTKIDYERPSDWRPLNRLAEHSVINNPKASKAEVAMDAYQIPQTMASADFITGELALSSNQVASVQEHNPQKYNYSLLSKQVNTQEALHENEPDSLLEEPQSSNKAPAGDFVIETLSNGEWSQVVGFYSVEQAKNYLDLLRDDEIGKASELLAEAGYSNLEQHRLGVVVSESTLRLKCQRSGMVLPNTKTQKQAFTASLSEDLSKPLVLFAESKNHPGKYVVPIKIDENGDHSFGGQGEIAVFNSEAALAIAINDLISDAKFSGEHQWESENSFRLRELDKNLKPIRSTEASFEELFSKTPKDVAMAAAAPDSSGLSAKPAQAENTLEAMVTDLSTGETTTSEVTKSEAPFLKEAFNQENSSTAFTDTQGKHEEVKLPAPLPMEAVTQGIFKTNTYARNGAVIGSKSYLEASQIPSEPPIAYGAIVTLQSGSNGFYPYSTSLSAYHLPVELAVGRDIAFSSDATLSNEQLSEISARISKELNEELHLGTSVLSDVSTPLTIDTANNNLVVIEGDFDVVSIDNLPTLAPEQQGATQQIEVASATTPELVASIDDKPISEEFSHSPSDAHFEEMLQQNDLESPSPVEQDNQDTPETELPPLTSAPQVAEKTQFQESASNMKDALALGAGIFSDKLKAIAARNAKPTPDQTPSLFDQEQVQSAEVDKIETKPNSQEAAAEVEVEVEVELEQPNNDPFMAQYEDVPNEYFDEHDSDSSLGDYFDHYTENTITEGRNQDTAPNLEDRYHAELQLQFIEHHAHIPVRGYSDAGQKVPTWTSSADQFAGEINSTPNFDVQQLRIASYQKLTPTQETNLFTGEQTPTDIGKLSQSERKDIVDRSVEKLKSQRVDITNILRNLNTQKREPKANHSLDKERSVQATNQQITVPTSKAVEALSSHQEQQPVTMEVASTKIEDTSNTPVVSQDAIEVTTQTDQNAEPPTIEASKRELDAGSTAQKSTPTFETLLSELAKGSPQSENLQSLLTQLNSAVQALNEPANAQLKQEVADSINSPVKVEQAKTQVKAESPQAPEPNHEQARVAQEVLTKSLELHASSPKSAQLKLYLFDLSLELPNRSGEQLLDLAVAAIKQNSSAEIYTKDFENTAENRAVSEALPGRAFISNWIENEAELGRKVHREIAELSSEYHENVRFSQLTDETKNSIRRALKPTPESKKKLGATHAERKCIRNLVFNSFVPEQIVRNVVYGAWGTKGFKRQEIAAVNRSDPFPQELDKVLKKACKDGAITLNPEKAVYEYELNGKTKSFSITQAKDKIPSVISEIEMEVALGKATQKNLSTKRHTVEQFCRLAVESVTEGVYQPPRARKVDMLKQEQRFEAATSERGS